jgi:hypothetical protein
VFGHKHERQWAAYAGTVAESRKHGRDWNYVVDYRRPTGEAVRVTVPAFDARNIELPPGTPVRIEVNAHSGEGRLTVPPAGAGALSVRDALDLARRELQGQGQGQGRGAGSAGALSVRQALHLAQELQGQERAARTAALARPSQVGPELPAQDGIPGPAGPTAFSSPDPSVGQPGFSPVAPATTFSSPAGPGSFNAGSAVNSGVPAGAGGSFGSGSFGDFGETKSDRIARLEDQRDRGQITAEQFAAQRQQIENEI